MKFILILISFLQFSNLALAEEAQRNCIADICFAEQVSEKQLNLLQVAKFRYFGFKVYAAALYSAGTQAEVKRWIDTGESPKAVALTLHYFMDFTAEDFQKSGTQLIRENEEISFESVKAGLEKINSLYAPVKEGDQYTILFIPGEGTKLLLNGVTRGVVPGDEFGRAYLGIWLSKTSVGESFTNTLLGLS